VELCDHSLEQAEQCTYLVHYKGKCVVKLGTIEELKPVYRAIQDRGLTVEIQ
jgi:ATP-dependent Clp protease adaptor protein ClpS